MSSKLKTILSFAKLGVPILPLAPGSMEPAVAGGAKATATSPETLTRLYATHPDYGYGWWQKGAPLSSQRTERTLGRNCALWRRNTVAAGPRP